MRQDIPEEPARRGSHVSINPPLRQALSSLVYTPYKQRGITRAEAATLVSTFCLDRSTQKYGCIIPRMKGARTQS
jgi:hypothetical protein